MKKSFTTIVSYLVIFLLIYGVINWWRAPTMPQTPQLLYQDRHANTTDVITQSHDTPILLYFWGTWCSVCTLTTPHIQTLHSDGAPIVSIAVKSASTAELSTYLTTHNYTFITINDLDGAIFNAWQGKVTPSFVILKDGKVQQSFTGITPLWLLKLRLYLASMG